jgi:hypothetical protein
MAKLGDVIKVYTKASMDGQLIIRKRGVTRRSARVLERNRMFAEVAHSGRLSTACAGKPWKAFVSCLRTQARSAGLGR